MKVALINPNWRYGGSIYFGCPSPARASSLPSPFRTPYPPPLPHPSLPRLPERVREGAGNGREEAQAGGAALELAV
jgi:hypothetical protein